MTILPARLGLVAAGLSLLTILGVELTLSVSQQSQTIDEAVHVYAGYRYWKNLDFGVNPEHPPLAKLIATAPLLQLQLREPRALSGGFKEVEYLEGREFLYSNDAEDILYRTRRAVSVFALFLALAVFAAAYEMFGAGTAVLALTLLVFEPTLLANGALVTTDTAVTCCLFVAIYALYRYLKKPSAWRLLWLGLSSGATLAVKHSGVILIPLVVLLACFDVICKSFAGCPNTGTGLLGRMRRAGSYASRLLGPVAVAIGIAMLILWSTYTFRFEARPAGKSMTPPLSDTLRQSHHPLKAQILGAMLSYKLLPEAYVYGLVDIAQKTNAALTCPRLFYQS